MRVQIKSSRRNLRQSQGPRRPLRQRRLWWQILRTLPLLLRAPIIRNMFQVETKGPEQLIFKIADTTDEIEQAFKILHDSFVELGYMKVQHSGLRVTKYHLLPTTNILVAKQGDEVIGTVSVVIDSPLGLPMDSEWKLSDLRRSYNRIAEISALAIKKGYRSQRGRLLLPLCKLMYEFCRYRAGVDVMVASTLNEVKDFYRCVLLFKPIDGYRVRRYDFVQGVEAVAQYLPLNEASEKIYHKVYGQKRPEKNLFHYFVEARLPNLILPKQKYFTTPLSVMSPALIEYFFGNRSDVLNQLTEEDRTALNNIYFFDSYKQVVGPSATTRKYPRFSVFCQGQLTTNNRENVQKITVLEASQKGLGLRLQGPFSTNFEKSALLSMNIGTDERGQTKQIQVPVEIRYHNQNNGIVGLVFKDLIPKEWSELIEHLEKELLSSALDEETLLNANKSAA